MKFISSTTGKFLIIFIFNLSWAIQLLGNENAAEAKSLVDFKKTNINKPWVYWWWMGSAVDKKNLTANLELYQQAGIGGVHIIPIYGVKGWEEKYIDFLSPSWLDLLKYTIEEASRLGMGVDMSTGTGWPFGGPQVNLSLIHI